MSEPKGAEPSQAMKKGLIEAIPNLRAFAYSLCGSADRADDLVQETLTKAWSKRHTFQPGTNLKAWLFTILRNTYFSEFRKKRREVEDADGSLSEGLSEPASQHWQIDFSDMLEALKELPEEQREALILVTAEGLAYEEVALILDCAVGTVKSRVNRARKRLAELMLLDADDQLAGGRLKQPA